MNNNQQQQRLGLDQPMAPNPQLQTTDDYLLTDAVKPQENSFPALKKFAYEPDVDIQTQLIDHSHYLNSGVYNPNNPASVNSSSQAELRMKLEQQRARQTGRSIYQTPVTQGVSITPNVDDGERPDATQLEELRREERYSNLKRRVQNLRLEEQQMASKLNSCRRVLHQLQEQLEELE